MEDNGNVRTIETAAGRHSEIGNLYTSTGILVSYTKHILYRGRNTQAQHTNSKCYHTCVHTGLTSGIMPLLCAEDFEQLQLPIHAGRGSSSGSVTVLKQLSTLTLTLTLYITTWLTTIHQIPPIMCITTTRMHSTRLLRRR